MVLAAAEEKEQVRRLIGMADCFELLRVMFSFPERTLAEGLASGKVAQDVADCLEDAGAEEEAISRIQAEFACLEVSDEDRLCEGMRQTYSQWYLAPGSKVPIFPYESAFRFVFSGQKGTPALFRTPVALDVKELMGDAGVVPADAAREPVDSIWNELSFLAFLFGSWAKAVFDEKSEESADWRRRCCHFWSTHGEAWIPSFMDATRELAIGPEGADPYGAFARFGSLVVGLTARFFREERK